MGKILISTSAKKSAVATAVKAKSISPALDKKLDSLVTKAVKTRTLTLSQLDSKVSGFLGQLKAEVAELKKKLPPLKAEDLKKQIVKQLLSKSVHSAYVDASGVLKLQAGSSVAELVENCGVDLSSELPDDMLQEIRDTFRKYF